MYPVHRGLVTSQSKLSARRTSLSTMVITVKYVNCITTATCDEKHVFSQPFDRLTKFVMELGYINLL